MNEQNTLFNQAKDNAELSLMPAFIEKKIKDLPPKRAKKNGSLKRKLTLSVIVLSVITGLVGYSVYQADKWFDSHEINFQSPVKLQAPVTITKVVEKELKPSEIYEAMVQEAKAQEHKPEPAPQAIKQPQIGNGVIAAHKHAELLWAIHGLESTYGKNDKCHREGKVNGMGWGQSATKGNCYAKEDFPILIDKVGNRLDQFFSEGMTVAQALCTYNLGKPDGKILDDCKYYQDYLKLNN